MKLKCESKPSRCKPNGKKKENKNKGETAFKKPAFNPAENYPFRPMTYC